MKHLCFLLFILPLFTVAQTYPFNEGFEGLASTQVPPGWGGNMEVLLYHGRNDSKGLTARLNSAVTEGSSITPLIGPLTISSFISFYYRIIDFAFYPDGAATNFDVGDQIEIMISTDSIIYSTIQLIDMNNHNTSFNFVKKKIFLSQYAGSSVYFKIHCQFGSGAGYYVDFDTIVVANDPQLDVADIDNSEQISIYPNPCSSVSNIQIPSGNQYPLKVVNAIGEIIFEENNAVNRQLSSVNYQLPVVNWLNGIYFVRIGNQITRKLIVQH